MERTLGQYGLSLVRRGGLRPLPSGRLESAVEWLVPCAAGWLVAVLIVDDLRRTEVQISRQISWERTAQDVVWELSHNPTVNGLSRCAYAIVSFGTAGAILLSRDAAEPERCRLFADPEVMEAGWEPNGKGRMIGYTVTLTASIVRQLLVSPEQPDLGRGIQAGVAVTRRLYQDGYGGGGADVTFPVEAIAGGIGTDTEPLHAVPIQDPVRFLAGQANGNRNEPAASPRGGGFWTILEDRYPEGLDRVAEEIVLDGVEHALEGVPIGRIGALVTVDRQEIESLRSVQGLLAEYGRDRRKKPGLVAARTVRLLL